MNIQYAEFNDLQEILELQYLAYQSEAQLFRACAMSSSRAREVRIT